jgi:glycosyltransferase involved in cell wall biosynthesis
LDVKKPLIVTLHSFTDLLLCKNSKYRENLVYNFNRQFRFIDHLVFVSNVVKQQGNELGLGYPENNTVIYNGISVHTTFDRKSNKEQICFVGNLSINKGVLEILEAMRVINTKISIIWIGKGKLENEIEKFSYNHNIDSTFLGYLDNALVKEYVADSKLLVVPSITESFGLVYIESLLVGTPVIGFYKIIDEFRKILYDNDKEGDWLIPFNREVETHYDLAEKIRKGMGIKKRKEYSEEKKYIKNKVAEYFSWPQISNYYNEIYLKYL